MLIVLMLVVDPETKTIFPNAYLSLRIVYPKNCCIYHCYNLLFRVSTTGVRRHPFSRTFRTLLITSISILRYIEST